MQVSNMYGYTGFHNFDNCYLIYSNKELLPSLPRDIIKDYSKAKLSYFERLGMNELEYAKSLFYDEYDGGAILFTDSKVESSLSDLITY